MKVLAFIFIGGGLGSVLRFVFSKYLNPLVANFPLGTLTANVVACLLLGVLAGYSLKTSNNTEFVKYFMIVGLCGGFSTFSTFAFEMQTIFKQGLALETIVYLLLSLLLGIGAVLLGFFLAK